MTLAIPLAVILLNYTPGNSIDTVPITIDYVRYTGLDLSKHVDSSVVISCLVVGYFVFLAVITKMVEQLNKKLEKLTQKLQKPMNKYLGDEKLGGDHLLPLYHTAGTMGNASAVKMRRGNGGGKDAFPCVIREEPDRSMLWWAVNMHKRFYEEAY
ncbi:MAG: hypothetical protein LQ339_005683 [Xanthoria mediterranea]|nr:MAG: hypothetical protein LQ339_005683 [Xanthoria mediterranea]